MKIKKSLLSILLIFFAGTTLAQNSTDRYQTNVQIPTNIERYKIDYQLVDESLIENDNSILNNIDLEKFEYIRLETEDVVFYDRNLNIEILIYSNQKTTLRKKSHHEIYYNKH